MTQIVTISFVFIVFSFGYDLTRELAIVHRRLQFICLQHSRVGTSSYKNHSLGLNVHALPYRDRQYHKRYLSSVILHDDCWIYVKLRSLYNNTRKPMRILC